MFLFEVNCITNFIGQKQSILANINNWEEGLLLSITTISIEHLNESRLQQRHAFGFLILTF
jgi:hypothetical protein